MDRRVNTESPESRRGMQKASGKQVCIHVLLLKKEQGKKHNKLRYTWKIIYIDK